MKMFPFIPPFLEAARWPLMEPRLKAASLERINNVLCYDDYYLRESSACVKEKGGWKLFPPVNS